MLDFRKSKANYNLALELVFPLPLNFVSEKKRGTEYIMAVLVKIS